MKLAISYISLITANVLYPNMVSIFAKDIYRI